MSKKAKQSIDLGFLKGEGARTDLSGMFAASVSSVADMQQATMVKVDKLLNNPYQPRLEIKQEGVEELAQVIRAQGFQGVLVARPDKVNKGFYQLTAGHRRRAAAELAGLTSLPVVVQEMTDEEMATIAITENIQREDLTPLEEGKIYLLMDEEMGYTHEQIAREVGRKRGYIENRIRVARAPRDVQALVQQKPDSLRAVANLIKVNDEQDRAEIIRQILAGVLTVEDLPGYIAGKAQDSKGVANGETVASEASASAQPIEVHGLLMSSSEDENAPAAEAAPVAGSEAEAAVQSEGVEDEPAEAASDTRLPAQPRMLADERSAARIGNAKLAAVLRYLNTYRDATAGRQQVSEQEQASLARIKTLADELYERLAAPDSPVSPVSIETRAS